MISVFLPEKKKIPMNQEWATVHRVAKNWT